RRPQGPGRAPPPRDPATRVGARAPGDRHRGPLRRCHPPGDLAAPARAEGRRARERTARRHAPPLSREAGRDAERTDIPRRVLDIGARAAPRRGGGRATRQGEALMAEVVREVMVDATPETIWPFLTEPDKHIQWEGTVAEIDPRPGGTYRVL